MRQGVGRATVLLALLVAGARALACAAGPGRARVDGARVFPSRLCCLPHGAAAPCGRRLPSTPSLSYFVHSGSAGRKGCSRPKGSTWNTHSCSPT